MDGRECGWFCGAELVLEISLISTISNGSGLDWLNGGRDRIEPIVRIGCPVSEWEWMLPGGGGWVGCKEREDDRFGSAGDMTEIFAIDCGGAWGAALCAECATCEGCIEWRSCSADGGRLTPCCNLPWSTTWGGPENIHIISNQITQLVPVQY